MYQNVSGNGTPKLEPIVDLLLTRGPSIANMNLTVFVHFPNFYNELYDSVFCLKIEQEKTFTLSVRCTI